MTVGGLGQNCFLDPVLMDLASFGIELPTLVDAHRAQGQWKVGIGHIGAERRWIDCRSGRLGPGHAAEEHEHKGCRKNRAFHNVPPFLSVSVRYTLQQSLLRHRHLPRHP